MQRLAEALEALRAQVAADVATDGADRHQVALDYLVWCHAHAEAARALREWAARNRHPLAAEMADAAEEEARAFVLGSGPEAAIAAGRRHAEIAGRLVPLEDLGAPDEHRLLRSTLRDFAERQIGPHAQAIHRRDLDVPEPVIAGAAELGLFGMSVPTRYGGTQEREDFTAMLIATEELSRVSLAAGGSLITRPEILVRALLRGGTEDQRRRWLPAIASGRKLVAVGVTEPDHGSDVAGLGCRASRRPDGAWEVAGTKLWCTFAGRSELLMLLLRTAERGHRGLSVFVLEKPAFAGHAFEHLQPGGGALRARAIPTIGYRGMHTFELSFDRYVLPADALVGGDEWLNRGFYLQMEGFAMGRIQTAGRAVGVMQAALDAALAYTRERRVFGSPVFDHQLARAKLGAAAMRVQAARQLSYRAARLLDAGGGQVEASLAKLYASRMAELVTREAMQVHGAMGYGEETDVSRHFVDARVLAIFEGAEEVLSLRVVGRSLLDRPA
ncbi:MAG TPA: acyl-CoA dehydrogenase family protein [Candidatus Dormibacteraeota bacterium]|nr:acyl-CoA dehydrogenase family protein [Candidatus Dormibacteraeota bacterium]